MAANIVPPEVRQRELNLPGDADVSRQPTIQLPYQSDLLQSGKR
jgi:hypothetical protein